MYTDAVHTIYMTSSYLNCADRCWRPCVGVGVDLVEVHECWCECRLYFWLSLGHWFTKVVPGKIYRSDKIIH